MIFIELFMSILIAVHVLYSEQCMPYLSFSRIHLLWIDNYIKNFKLHNTCVVTRNTVHVCYG